ncbi:MAG: sulfatase [Tunicatimonas sp.]
MKASLLLFLLVIGALLPSEATAQSTPPNIVVFIADDAGWRDFGCYGNAAIRTPNIDRLAQQGMRFDQVFLTTPQCSPTRTSLLAGQYAHTLRTEDLHEPLAEGQTILPTHLKKAGYYTGLIGKTHIGLVGEAKFDLVEPLKQSEPQPDDFKTLLDSAQDQPFFVWYAFSDPHRGYQPNTIDEPHDPDQVVVPPYLVDTPETRRDLAQYYDEIGRLDRNVGRVLQLLEEAGKASNTAIFFLSDNGKPFTRAKGTLYDAGIRTPLVVRWPEQVDASSTYGGLLSAIHLAPTIMDMAGVAVDTAMVGRSLLPILTRNAVVPDEFVFSERNWHDCDEHMRSVRSDSFKLIKNAYIEWPHGTAADLAGSPSHQALLRGKAQDRLTDAQQLVFEVPRPEIEFYNVKVDPYELTNLAYDVRYRPQIQTHYAALRRWQQQTDDFPPHVRRRYDNTDRVTGTMYHIGRPESYGNDN